MRRARLAVFLALPWLVIGCTEAQYKKASDAVAKGQAAVDAASGVGIGGPYTLGASILLNAIQCFLTRKTKSAKDRAMADASLKTKLFGVASRALDAATGGEAGKFINPEIEKTPGVSPAVLKPARDLAKAREI